MANDVKWIKITTDMFDDEKILLIESLPDAYAIITVWFKLLCLAGKQNNSGVFMMGQMPYTDKMIATIFRMKESTVTMALQTFEQFGMVEIIDGVITIPNWNKHQTLDAYEKKKARDRLYQAERRASQKALIEKSSDKSSDVAVSDKEEDKEEDKDIRKKNKKKKTSSSDFESILSYIPDDSLKELYLDYIAMRKSIKSPITSERALKMLINKVNTLEPGNIERQKKLLENAIVSNWKSVYPLKDEPNPQNAASYDLNAFKQSGIKGDDFMTQLQSMYEKDGET